MTVLGWASSEDPRGAPWLQASHIPRKVRSWPRSQAGAELAAEVAYGIASLASPLAGSTTGTILRIDGGMTSLRL